MLCQVVLLFEVVCSAECILSWFPLQPGGVMAKINGLLVRVTEPVLEPVRRILPRMGMFDLSPILVFLVLEIVVRGLILQCYASAVAASLTGAHAGPGRTARTARHVAPPVAPSASGRTMALMELSPKSITGVQFRTVRKGYDPEEVRGFLAQLARGVEAVQAQSAATESRARSMMTKLQELSAREDPDPGEAMKRTLLLAQRTADAAVAEANEEARVRGGRRRGEVAHHAVGGPGQGRADDHRRRGRRPAGGLGREDPDRGRGRRPHRPPRRAPRRGRRVLERHIRDPARAHQHAWRRRCRSVAARAVRASSPTELAPPSPALAPGAADADGRGDVAWSDDRRRRRAAATTPTVAERPGPAWPSRPAAACSTTRARPRPRCRSSRATTSWCGASSSPSPSPTNAGKAAGPSSAGR